MHRLVLLTTFLAAASAGATLQKLTLDDMILKSTDIVRARVSGTTSSAFRGTSGRGGMIYTHYVIDVSERYKGSTASRMDVAVPGGMAQGYQQVFAGAPALKAGEEYVFFLWTSRSGLVQVIGLTQGLLTISADTAGKLTATRQAASELMLDGSGQPVTDQGLRLTLSDLRTRIGAVLGKADR